MAQVSNAEVETSKDINLNELIKPYLKKWWWFVLSVLALSLIHI